MKGCGQKTFSAAFIGSTKEMCTYMGSVKNDAECTSTCGHHASVKDVSVEQLSTEKRVRSVVVVPWHPHAVSAEEEMSLKSIRQFCEGAELVLVAADALQVPPFLEPDRVEIFPQTWFRSFEANNRLMTSVSLYERFEDYDQMVLVHVDVLLFKPLAPLCQKLYPWSYVGAPWVGRETNGRFRLEGVGNGGFSIRRIPDFLDVLRGSAIPFWPRYTTKRRGLALWAYLFACHVAGLKGETVAHTMNHRRNIWEDVFWSKVATCLSSRFTVAPLSEALAFSYEMFPRFAHQENHYHLPCGIHGWWRHDIEFVRELMSI